MAEGLIDPTIAMRTGTAEVAEILAAETTAIKDAIIVAMSTGTIGMAIGTEMTATEETIEAEEMGGTEEMIVTEEVIVTDTTAMIATVETGAIDEIEMSIAETHGMKIVMRTAGRPVGMSP